MDINKSEAKMSFSETRFPDDIAYGAIGGPEFSTEVITTKNGYEKRNINWSSARIRYNVSHGVKTPTQLDKLIKFFRARKGKAYGFRFKDWTDYKCTNQDIKVSQGNKCQLIKSYCEQIRIITKPIRNTVKIFVDQEELTQGYTLDYTSGVITFNQKPSPTVINASFEFDVPARFDTDVLSASIDSLNLYSWQNIPIIEIKT